MRLVIARVAIDLLALKNGIRTGVAITSAISFLILQSCSKQDPVLAKATPLSLLKPVDAARLVDADADPANWLMHGRTYTEQRFSPLMQVDKKTVSRLRLDWYLDLGSRARGQESTPLVIDGRLYTSTSWSRVVATDAASGRVLWRFDPKVPGEWGINACCDVVNRGLAAWRGSLFIGTLDGRLVAIDALTGKALWETLVVDRAERTSITGAPRVINGKVYIGSAGGEFGVRGRLTAVDAASGQILWRFFTVPGNPAMELENPHLAEAQSTWTGQWWLKGGGGAVWDAMSYDQSLDLLYVGTGNGSPWPQSARSPKGGDNLYVSSILALKAETGEVAWHYQTTPGDEWGYDAASQLILADLTIAGQLRRVLMQASANGFFYVLDRGTGQLISGTPYVPTSWAQKIDIGTGRPVEEPRARYSRTGKPFVARPGPKGAHSWHPMSFDPHTGLVYIPAQLNSARLSVGAEKTAGRYRLSTGAQIARSAETEPDSSQMIAWDPVQQRAPWVIEHPSPIASGVLATSGGLVFQGTTEGTLEAYSAENGERVWMTETGAAVTAAPITYSVNGKQYVAVLVGAGGGSMLEGGEAIKAHVPGSNSARLLVYSLSGNAKLPSSTPALVVPASLSLPQDAKTVETGKVLYASYCSRCHGANVINTGPLASLLQSQNLKNSKQWNLITYAGLLGSSGMPGFMAELSATDVEAVRSYIISRAGEAVVSPAK